MRSLLSKNAKLNFLRARVAVRKKRFGKEVSLVYTDPKGIEHSTGFCRTMGAAVKALKGWFTRTSGIAKVVLVITEEELVAKKSDLPPEDRCGKCGWSFIVTTMPQGEIQDWFCPHCGSSVPKAEGGV
jgi:ribosomal protein S27AE